MTEARELWDALSRGDRALFVWCVVWGVVSITRGAWWPLALNVVVAVYLVSDAVSERLIEYQRQTIRAQRDYIETLERLAEVTE